MLSTSNADSGYRRAYEYKPLQSPTQIRILTLEPGGREAPLCLSLTHASLDDAPSFEALSYAWGDATNRIAVEYGDKEMQITQNLYDALRHLRHLNSARYLWADAICINQADLVERGAQVQLMARIYSEADKVLLWLGQERQDVINTVITCLESSNSEDEKVSVALWMAVRCTE